MDVLVGKEEGKGESAGESPEVGGRETRKSGEDS